jgi:hypothetical protein
MACHICERLFTKGCLADPEANPYVTFVIKHAHGHQRLYAGKIISVGLAGYRIATPGGTQHLVKFHRIRCAEPRIFYDIIRVQCEKKRFGMGGEFNPNEYYDFGIFGY